MGFHLRDRYAQAFPSRLLKLASLPLGRQMKTEDAFLYESARMLNDAFAFTRNEDVAGDYAEFGVLDGRTFVEAWRAAERWRADDVNLHAYDSFEGLPSISGPDKPGPFTSGQFRVSRGVFERALRVARVPDDRVTITGGFFEDSLLAAPHHTIAIAWVDCDLYESTVPVLDFLTDQLQDGAVLIFDDWFCFRSRPDRGEQRACAEWLDRNPGLALRTYRDFHWAGRSFVVNRR
jgi:O-methyltransferase